MLLGETGGVVHRTCYTIFFSTSYQYNYLKIRKSSTKNSHYLLCMFLYGIQKRGSVITNILCKTSFIHLILFLCVIFAVMFPCIWAQWKYPYIKHVQDAVSIFIFYALFALSASSFFILLLLGLVALSLSNHLSYKLKRVISIIYIVHFSVAVRLVLFEQALVGEKSDR